MTLEPWLLYHCYIIYYKCLRTQVGRHLLCSHYWRKIPVNSCSILLNDFSFDIYHFNVSIVIDLYGLTDLHNIIMVKSQLETKSFHLRTHKIIFYNGSFYIASVEPLWNFTHHVRFSIISSILMYRHIIAALEKYESTVTPSANDYNMITVDGKCSRTEIIFIVMVVWKKNSTNTWTFHWRSSRLSCWWPSPIERLGRALSDEREVGIKTFGVACVQWKRKKKSSSTYPPARPFNRETSGDGSVFSVFFV